MRLHSLQTGRGMEASEQVEVAVLGIPYTPTSLLLLFVFVVFKCYGGY